MVSKIEAFNSNNPPFNNLGPDKTTQLINGSCGIYSGEITKESTSPTRSEYYRIELCMKGSLQVSYGQESFTYTKGTLHFNYPGQLFSIHEKSEDLVSYVIVFAENLMNELLSEEKIPYLYPFLNYGGVPFLKLSDEETKRTEQFFLELDTEIKNCQPDKLNAIKLLISLILLNTQRFYSGNGLDRNADTIYHSVNKTDIEKIYQVRRSILDDLTMPLTLSELAKLISMSETKMKQLFRQIFGRSIYNYYQAARMDEAARLLRHLSVSEVGYQLGFSNMSHFSRLFEKHHGLKPKKFKGCFN